MLPLRLATTAARRAPGQLAPAASVARASWSARPGQGLLSQANRRAWQAPPFCPSTARLFASGTAAGAEEPEPDAEPAAAAKPTETLTGAESSFEFQAEVAELLNIVANSLYTDKEVFVRELVSNASDALNKLRQAQMSGSADISLPLEIRVDVDEEAGTLTIQDTGIGMSKEELITNLGTIARSGSKAFQNELGDSDEQAKASIIGRFGVGFYSVFMAAEEVSVFSRSASTSEEGEHGTGWCWKADGKGSYTLAEADGVAVGTKIVAKLNTAGKEEFGSTAKVRSLIQKYSNFVSFPIAVDGEKANTVSALWAQQPSTVTEEQHNEFYRFISNAFDTPRYHFQFAADAPIAIQALVYVPQFSAEKMGVGRQEPGISVYSRKVLIKAKAEGVLPEWMRFLKGVVDSEDIPLNISREHMQDSGLIKRVGSVVARWLLGQLARQAKKDPAAYLEFYQEFGSFIKEGACSDNEHKTQIAKLLRFDSSKDSDMASPGASMASLAQYKERAVEGQNEIFYLAAPNRQLALGSPYYDGFQAAGLEVLLIYSDIDEFVMTHLGRFDGMQMVSIESGQAATALEGIEGKKADDKEDSEGKSEESSDGGASSVTKLTADEKDELRDWLTEQLKSRASAVRLTERKLTSSPALIVGHESATVRRWMKMADPASPAELPKQTLEINPDHPICVGLFACREKDSKLAGLVAEQLYDNALVAAGLLDDARQMLPRLQSLLGALVEPDEEPTEAPTEAPTKAETKE